MSQKDEIIDLFQRYSSKLEAASNQFHDFRAREGCFGPSSKAWTYEGAEAFWKYNRDFAPELSSLAIRLSSVTANSVPSERAFSNMNFIHSKARNRLSTAKADKLQFIHMNSRHVPERINAEDPDADQLLAEDEDELLQRQSQNIQEDEVDEVDEVEEEDFDEY